MFRQLMHCVNINIFWFDQTTNDRILYNSRKVVSNRHSQLFFPSKKHQLFLLADGPKERLTALHRLYSHCVVFTRAASTHTSDLVKEKVFFIYHQTHSQLRHITYTHTQTHTCACEWESVHIFHCI